MVHLDAKAARNLDRQVLRRAKAYLDEVCEFDDPRSRGKGLSGDLADYWRYRIGDYRVLVEIRHAELIIVALSATDPEPTEHPVADPYSSGGLD